MCKFSVKIDFSYEIGATIFEIRSTIKIIKMQLKYFTSYYTIDIVEYVKSQINRGN